MARLMKDTGNHFMIEVTSGKMWAHCIIREDCVVRCKKYHLHRYNTNPQCNEGHDHYHERWKPVPEMEYPLAKAVARFLATPTGWSITAKAQAVLSALLDEKSVTETDMEGDEEAAIPAASAEGKMKTGEADMSTKKTKVKKTSVKEKKTSVAAAFKMAIGRGLGKERALAFVREICPARPVPDSYYAWYKRRLEKQKEGT